MWSCIHAITWSYGMDGHLHPLIFGGCNYSSTNGLWPNYQQVRHRCGWRKVSQIFRSDGSKTAPINEAIRSQSALPLLPVRCEMFPCFLRPNQYPCHPLSIFYQSLSQKRFLFKAQYHISIFILSNFPTRIWNDSPYCVIWYRGYRRRDVLTRCHYV